MHISEIFYVDNEFRTYIKYINKTKEENYVQSIRQLYLISDCYIYVRDATFMFKTIENGIIVPAKEHYIENLCDAICNIKGVKTIRIYDIQNKRTIYCNPNEYNINNPFILINLFLCSIIFELDNDEGKCDLLEMFCTTDVRRKMAQSESICDKEPIIHLQLPTVII